MNIDKIKIYYYLNKNKKNLFELKHDSHFLKILGKNIDLINEIILDNILNDINAIIDFLYYIKNDEDKYNFLLIPKIRQIYFKNTYQDIFFSDNSYYVFNILLYLYIILQSSTTKGYGKWRKY